MLLNWVLVTLLLKAIIMLFINALFGIGSCPWQIYHTSITRCYDAGADLPISQIKLFGRLFSISNRDLI